MRIASFRNRSMGLLLVGLSLYAFIAPNVLAGWSLCFGLDGHIALENTNSKCCEKEEAAPEQSSLVQEKSDCGSCIDVSLSIEEMPMAKPWDSKHASPVAMPFTSGAVPTIFLRDVTTDLLPLPPPRSNPNLAILRTIVLLV